MTQLTRIRVQQASTVQVNGIRVVGWLVGLFVRSITSFLRDGRLGKSPYGYWAGATMGGPLDSRMIKVGSSRMWAGSGVRPLIRAMSMAHTCRPIS